MNHFPNIFYQILNYQTARVKFWILIVDLIYTSIKLNVLKTQNWWVEMNEYKIQYYICTPSILRQDSVDIIQISVNLQTFVYIHCSCSCSCMIHVGRCVDDTFTFYTIHLDADTATTCRLTQVCRRPATWKYYYLQLSLFWFRSLYTEYNIWLVQSCIKHPVHVVTTTKQNPMISLFTSKQLAIKT